MYVRRYIGRFPAAGEIVIFDRSWYNRAGVENVMGFISPKDVGRFLKSVRKSRNTSPTLASFSSNSGCRSASRSRRSAFSRASTTRCGNGSSARWIWNRTGAGSPRRIADVGGFEHHIASPRIVRSDDKKRARLNCISTLLDAISYKKISRPKVKLPKRSNKGAYDDQASLRGRKFVAEKSDDQMENSRRS
jgi:polyphosphate kinase